MKKNHTFFRCVLCLAFCLGLTACNLPGNNKETDINIQQTSVVQTVEALKTQIAVNDTPAAPMITTNTPQMLPTGTSTATKVPVNTSTPKPTYRVGNVIDVTYADNTVVKPGTAFTKKWKLTNTGTGTWSPNFKLVFVSGDAMSGPASKAIGIAVAPGQSIDVSVDLVAPSTVGTYQGKWMMQTDSGDNFGIGDDSSGSFWVKIVVQNDFAITNGVLAIATSDASATCPAVVTVTADITSSSAGTATYYFQTSLGNSSSYSLAFAAAGTITSAAYSFQVPSTQDVTISLYNDVPNHQAFGTKTVTVTCVP